MSEIEIVKHIKCDALIAKARRLSEAPRLNLLDINQLEKTLKVLLSNDFKYIGNKYDYEYIDFFDFYSFPTGIINKTKDLRKSCKLPNEYIVLAIDDVSVLLLKTMSSKKSEVIWCDEPDFFNICEGKTLQFNPTIFPSFTDFFEFLLDEEEKIRAENNQQKISNS